MVFRLPIHPWRRLEVVVAAALGLALLLIPGVVGADQALGRKFLGQARDLYRSGEYFKSARYAFAAAQESEALKDEAYSWITVGLVQAGLPQSASYFFIRTLQSGKPEAIRRALTQTEELVAHAGSDLFRKYLKHYTKIDDYTADNRSGYLYLQGKDELLGGREDRAVELLSRVSSQSDFYGYALQLRGTAHALSNRSNEAIEDFERCVKTADQLLSKKFARRATDQWFKEQKARIEDLKARCQAGIARAYYQAGDFQEADQAYDRIPKASFVWTDILFEQAWNAFAQQEYNRALGKLVTYKSPSLRFVFNSETDVLRAQSFLALCLYSDANEAINDFNSRYANIGQEVKRFVESNASNLQAFYQLGKRALQAPLHSQNLMNQMMNRFIRGPYFQTLVAAEKSIHKEGIQVDYLDRIHATRDGKEGFPGFLKQVLEWRLKSVRGLGGAFVKNSFLDYHSALIADFEKMAFIKLEMLSRAKDQLVNPDRKTDFRGRGSKEPSRKSYQYYWSFNGEFWADELGDYVFGLESECK